MTDTGYPILSDGAIARFRGDDHYDLVIDGTPRQEFAYDEEGLTNHLCARGYTPETAYRYCLNLRGTPESWVSVLPPKATS